MVYRFELRKPAYHKDTIISDAELPRLISEYKNGRTAEDLAEEYGVTSHTIHRALSRRVRALKHALD